MVLNGIGGIDALEYGCVPAYDGPNNAMSWLRQGYDIPTESCHQALEAHTYAKNGNHIIMA